MRRQREEAARAREKVDVLEGKIREIDRELGAEIEKVEASVDPMTEELEIVEIKPFKKDIQVTHCGVGWLPHVRVGEFEMRQAWAPAGSSSRTRSKQNSPNLSALMRGVCGSHTSTWPLGIMWFESAPPTGQGKHRRAWKRAPDPTVQPVGTPSR